MFNYRVLATGAVSGAALVSGIWLLVAQPLMPTSWSGNELVQAVVGGPGGTGTLINIAQLRNATAATLIATTNVTVNANNLQNRLMFTGAATTFAVNAPPNPNDGEMIEIVNASGTAFTGTITFTAAAGQTLVPASGAVTNLAASSSAEWQYVASTTTWYRLR